MQKAVIQHIEKSGFKLITDQSFICNKNKKLSIQMSCGQCGFVNEKTINNCISAKNSYRTIPCNECLRVKTKNRIEEHCSIDISGEQIICKECERKFDNKLTKYKFFKCYCKMNYHKKNEAIFYDLLYSNFSHEYKVYKEYSEPELAMRKNFDIGMVSDQLTVLFEIDDSSHFTSPTVMVKDIDVTEKIVKLEKSIVLIRINDSLLKFVDHQTLIDDIKTIITEQPRLAVLYKNNEYDNLITNEEIVKKIKYLKEMKSKVPRLTIVSAVLV